jgi:hypothetical protein
VTTGPSTGPSTGAVRSGSAITVATVMRPPPPGAVWSSSALRVPVDVPLVVAARRAMIRPPERRYDTLQCLGPDGGVVGELAVHDLFLALIDNAEPPDPPSDDHAAAP